MSLCVPSQRDYGVADEIAIGTLTFKDSLFHELLEENQQLTPWSSACPETPSMLRV